MTPVSCMNIRSGMEQVTKVIPSYSFASSRKDLIFPCGCCVCLRILVAFSRRFFGIDIRHFSFALILSFNLLHDRFGRQYTDHAMIECNNIIPIYVINMLLQIRGARGHERDR